MYACIQCICNVIFLLVGHCSQRLSLQHQCRNWCWVTH